MTTSWGYRSRTKHKFKKAFRRHGAVRISNYLKEYKKGDYVDIIVDGAIHKVMPQMKMSAGKQDYLNYH
jgi:large subunit ribosomal protein L21e